MITSYGFVLPVLEYCFAVWCSAADTHLRLLDRVVSGASFLTGGVFECDLAHRLSVAVLYILYKSRCNPMHPIYGALPVLLMCQCGLHPSRYRTTVHFYASSPQNLALSQDYYSPVSISVVPSKKI